MIVGKKISLHWMYSPFCIVSYNKNGTVLIVLSSHWFLTCFSSHFGYLSHRGTSFCIHCWCQSVSCASSHLVTSASTWRLSLTIWPPRVFFSAGNRRYSLDDCSPGTVTDIAGFIFTKLYHIMLLADRISYIEVKVINSSVGDIFVRYLLSWISSLRYCFFGNISLSVLTRDTWSGRCALRNRLLLALALAKWKTKMVVVLIVRTFFLSYLTRHVFILAERSIINPDNTRIFYTAWPTTKEAQPAKSVNSRTTPHATRTTQKCG